MTNTPNLDRVRAFIERREALIQNAVKTLCPDVAAYGRRREESPRVKLQPVDAARRTVVRALRPGAPGFEHIQLKLEP